MKATVWLLFFKYSSERGKNVYEQLTVDGLESSFFSVLWYDFMNKKNMFVLLLQPHTALSS